GPDVVLQLKIRLADEQQRIIDPLRVGMLAQHVGALFDGIVESLATRRPGGKGAKERKVAVAIYGLILLLQVFHAPVIRILGVVEGVVIRREVVVATAHKRVAAAPGNQEERGESEEKGTTHRENTVDG